MSDQAYAALCQRAYSAEPDWIGTGPDANIHAIRSHDPGANRVMICFRGSKEPRDWLLDLIAVPAIDLQCWTHWKLGLVHTGFMVGAKSIAPQIAEAVQGHKFALCGHSLGGALALLVAALMLVEDGPVPDEIVTFGAPRAGMFMLQNVLHSIDVRQYRFGADMVPLVPTHPYAHVREPLIQIGEPIPLMGDLFINHHIENYIMALAARGQANG